MESITPYTRKEKFLAYAAGEDVDKPTPITREEYFLCYLGDSSASIPDPITRTEKFIAKIYNDAVETPEPTTRLEYIFAYITDGSRDTFDAFTPITREEHFLLNAAEYIKQHSHIAFTLSYYNDDGSVLLYSESVTEGGNGEYKGETPTKASTAQYDYTFAGWAKTQGSTTVDADALTGVTEDRNVYAVFSESVRTYTVYFYNYDNTLLQTVQNVPYGGSATYTEATPTKAGTSTKEYVFTGWSPSPNNISGDTSCVAQYNELTQTITDTWEQIIANANDGTYANRYNIGDTKIIDLGTEGKVAMEIVAFNSDILASDSTKKAAITWISKQLLDNTHRMNPTIDNNTQGTGAIGGWEYSDMRGYLNSTIKPLIPSNIRSAIKEVTKYSKIYDTSGSAVNNVSTDDKVWIPSAFETGFSDFETLGTSYTSKFIDNTSRIKHRVGKANLAYHLRSAHANYGFEFISTDGSRSYGNSHMEIGIALGFCIGTTPEYTVYFYNYDNTLLQTVTGVPYGGSATYTEATPTKSGYNFTGWSPSPTNISGDTSCYAQFE